MSADEQLQRIFACCDPILERDDQIAYALHVACGLTYGQVARAFLLPTTSMARRLTDARARLRVPPFREKLEMVWEDRLQAAMSTLYLLFNEGYAAANGSCLIRGALCDQAIGLTRLLRARFTRPLAELDALLSLMLLSDSRRNARVDETGDLVPLCQQDRALWNQEMIAEGCRLLKDALNRETPGQYALQAAIAAVHAEAKRADNTDWRQIGTLYERLYELRPSPMVALNYAIAISMYEGPLQALDLVDALRGKLARHHLWHATRADLLRRMGRVAEAVAGYRNALALVENEAERRFILRRLRELDACPND